jgi:hypothetical protein
MPFPLEHNASVDRDGESDSLAALLRDRALAASPVALVAQLGGGLLLNAASLYWHPEAWPVPVLTGFMLVAHAGWAYAVQCEAREAMPVDDDAALEGEGDVPAHELAPLASDPSVWWLRRVSAGLGVLSLIGLFAVLGIGLLGRLQS